MLGSMDERRKDVETWHTLGLVILAPLGALNDVRMPCLSNGITWSKHYLQLESFGRGSCSMRPAKMV